MPNSTEKPIKITNLTPFDTLIDHLDHLTRTHALAYRLQVGQLLLDAFYDGDLHAYQSRHPAKDLRFSEFLRERHDDLERIGLSKQLARDCIRAQAVWRTLPDAVRAGLGLGQLTLLAQLGDASARDAVAVAALRHGWTLQQLADAVAVVRGGGALDAAHIAAIEGEAVSDAVPVAGGADDAANDPPKGTLQAGRLVTEAEQWTGQLGNWSQRWATVDVRKLRPAQRQRLLDAAARLEAEAATLRKRLQATVKAPT